MEKYYGATAPLISVISSALSHYKHVLYLFPENFEPYQRIKIGNTQLSAMRSASFSRLLYHCVSVGSKQQVILKAQLIQTSQRIRHFPLQLRFNWHKVDVVFQFLRTSGSIINDNKPPLRGRGGRAGGGEWLAEDGWVGADEQSVTVFGGLSTRKNRQQAVAGSSILGSGINSHRLYTCTAVVLLFAVDDSLHTDRISKFDTRRAIHTQLPLPTHSHCQLWRIYRYSLAK